MTAAIRSVQRKTPLPASFKHMEAGKTSHLLKSPQHGEMLEVWKRAADSRSSYRAPQC